MSEIKFTALFAIRITLSYRNYGAQYAENEQILAQPMLYGHQDITRAAHKAAQ